MPLPISLRAVMDEMEVVGDEITAYCNTRTGELLTIQDDPMRAADPDAFTPILVAGDLEEIEEARRVLEDPDFAELPTRLEIHEWEIMQRFCSTVQDTRLRDELLDAIHARGAFRAFKDAIHRHGIADDWYLSRDLALEQIAVRWLEARAVPYLQDTGVLREKRWGQVEKEPEPEAPRSVHEGFMQEALREAELALEKGERPIGAVVVHDGEIVGRGRARQHERGSEIAHAELNALLDAERFLAAHPHQCALYATVEPCVLCLGAIVMSGIDHVIYALADNWIKPSEMLRMDYVRRHIEEYIGGVSEGRSIALWERADPKELRMLREGRRRG